MRELDIYAAITELDEDILLEALPTAAPVPVHPRRTGGIGRFLENGWVIAALCVLVSGAVLGGVMWLGRQEQPFVPPAGTETEGWTPADPLPMESTFDSVVLPDDFYETEPETEALPTDPFGEVEPPAANAVRTTSVLTVAEAVNYAAAHERNVVVRTYRAPDGVYITMHDAQTNEAYTCLFFSGDATLFYTPAGEWAVLQYAVENRDGIPHLVFKGGTVIATGAYSGMESTDEPTWLLSAPVHGFAADRDSVVARNQIHYVRAQNEIDDAMRNWSEFLVAASTDPLFKPYEPSDALTPEVISALWDERKLSALWDLYMSDPGASTETEAATKPEIVTQPEVVTETEPPLVEATGLVYESNGDGTCTLKSLGTCRDTRIIIPDRSPDGDLVTAVWGSVFHDKKTLVEVHLPNGATRVPQFIGCYALKRVKLPAGATEMTTRAFDSCSQLEEVDFNGASIAVIPNGAFSSTGLVVLTLPAGVTTIEELAFSGSKKLTTVICGPTLSRVGGRAFDGCESLRELRTADSPHSLTTLTNIGENAFRGTALTSIAFSNDLAVIGSGAFHGLRSPVAVDLGNTQIGYLPSLAFAYSKLQSITLPEGVTSLGSSCFYGCLSLTEVHLPDSLERIDTNAFWGCTALGSVRLGPSLQRIAPRAFEEMSAAILWCDSPTIEEIGYEAFAGYLGTAITIPASVTEIGAGALMDCPNLQRIDIPFIGASAEHTNSSKDCLGYLFAADVDVWDQETVIPRSLKTVILRADAVGTGEFQEVSIESVVFGANLTSIQHDAFDLVTTLKNVYFEGDATAWATVNNQSPEVSAATVWFYSETAPTGAGHYWHYGEDGATVRW